MLKAHWPHSPSIAQMMRELKEFRASHPAPQPLPPKLTRRQKLTLEKLPKAQLK